MKLNRSGREELRSTIEKILSNVPDGKRVYIEKDVLEKALFENIVVDNVSFKLPIWSGPFLRKIDLSEISFADVDWSDMNWRTINNLYNYYSEHRIDKEAFEYMEKKLSEIWNKLGKSYYVDYSNTNANIVLKKDQFSGLIVIQSANFYGLDLSYLDNSDILAIRAVDCNFGKTGLKISSDVSFGRQFTKCSFEDLDLSNVTIDAKNIANRCFPYDYNNLARTNLNIIYHPEDFPVDSSEYIYWNHLIKKGYLDGCNITEAPIRQKVRQQNHNIIQKS